MNPATSLKIFRITVWWVAIYHAALALIGTLATTDIIISAVHTVYGVTLTANPELLPLAKFASAYMAVFAVAMIILALDPVKYRNLVWVPITLFSIRIVERIVFFKDLDAAFNITMMQNLRVIIPIAIILALLIIFRPKDQAQ